jgi:hypothetical protein
VLVARWALSIDARCPRASSSCSGSPSARAGAPSRRAAGRA